MTDNTQEAPERIFATGNATTGSWNAAPATFRGPVETQYIRADVAKATRSEPMTELNVHFINRGFGTDDGYKLVELKELRVCEFTQTPEAIIDNPYFPGDTLRARFEVFEWVCDLD